MKTIVAVIATGMLLGAGIYSTSPVQADSCGAKEDPFVCTARLETDPPTPGESAFINLVRGHVPGSDADLLVTGRTICHSSRVAIAPATRPPGPVASAAC
jgi:hypothetical protein